MGVVHSKSLMPLNRYIEKMQLEVVWIVYMSTNIAISLLYIILNNY